MRLLLVEDDVILGDGIRAGLKQEGYTVDWLEDGLAAERALRLENFDLVLLDINLPGKSGIEVLKAFRDEGKSTPVLMLTARDGVSDRVLGLDSGADDYMVKPFDLDELSARVRALLRRSTGRTTTVLTNAGLMLDPASHIVTVDERRIELSQREFALLQVLMEHMNKVLPRPRLEEALYGCGEDIESNALEVHIHHLRRKLGDSWIRTVRGIGYIMEKHQE